MTLIPALAHAHSQLQITGPDNAALQSTARKIEATLVDLLKALPEQDRARYAGPLMNSGSLKALKLVPEDARAANFGYIGGQPDSKIILAQAPSFIREAMKRGYKLEASDRLRIFKQLAAAPEQKSRKTFEDLILNSPTQWGKPLHIGFAEMILHEMAQLEDEAAAAIAPFAIRLLKACIKADPDGARRTFDAMFALYDPGAASETLYVNLMSFALLGLSKPKKDVFEHDEMERLANAIASTKGRAEMKAQTDGLEAWFGGGYKTPPQIIREFQAKRARWSRPSTAPSYRPQRAALVRW